MAFADPTKGRVVMEASGMQEIELEAATICQAGDLLGYNAGWVLADGTVPTYAKRIAVFTQPTAGGKVVAAKSAKIDLGATCTATPGARVYLSDVAGDYVAAAGTSLQQVGEMSTAQICDVVLSDSYVTEDTVLEESVLDAELVGTDMAAGANLLGSQSQELNLGVNSGVIPITGVATADVAADAGLLRTQMASEAAAPYKLPLELIRNEDGTVATATPGAGLFTLVPGAWGTGGMQLDTLASQNNTTTAGGFFTISLPPEYEAGELIDVRISALHEAVAGGTTLSGTVDVSAFELDGEGDPGADLCGTAAQATAGASADYDFVIDPAGCVAGDKIQVQIRATSTEGDNAGTSMVTIGNVEVFAGIQG